MVICLVFLSLPCSSKKGLKLKRVEIERPVRRQWPWSRETKVMPGDEVNR